MHACIGETFGAWYSLVGHRSANLVNVLVAKRPMCVIHVKAASILAIVVNHISERSFHDRTDYSEGVERSGSSVALQDVALALTTTGIQLSKHSTRAQKQRVSIQFNPSSAVAEETCTSR